MRAALRRHPMCAAARRARSSLAAVAGRRQRRAAEADATRGGRAVDRVTARRGADALHAAGTRRAARHCLARLDAGALDIALAGPALDVLTRVLAGALDQAARRAGALHAVAARVIGVALHVARVTGGARDRAAAVGTHAVDHACVLADAAARALRGAAVAAAAAAAAIRRHRRIDLFGARHDTEAVDAIAAGVAVGGLGAREVTALVRDRTARGEREHDADLDRQRVDELVHGRPP